MAAGPLNGSQNTSTTEPVLIDDAWAAAAAAAHNNVMDGYAWTKKKGYFELPVDCVEDREGVTVCHHNTKSWKKFLGEGLWEDADNESDGRSWSSNAGWNNRDGRKNNKRDGDIPEWDGKTGHRTTYFRKIDLWAATTGVEPAERGCRLLQKLTGEAFEKSRISQV